MDMKFALILIMFPHRDVVVVRNIPHHVGVLPRQVKPHVGGEDLIFLIQIYDLLQTKKGEQIRGHLSTDPHFPYKIPNCRGTLSFSEATGLSKLL